MLIRIRLREALEANSERTGRKWTYADLAKETGLSRATIESIATRPSYNATLDCIARLCSALDTSPGELLELINVEEPESLDE
jgi:putative transcriptional regulator